MECMPMQVHLVEEYLGFLQHERHLAEKTVQEYMRDLRRYILWCQEKLIVPLEATPDDMRRYIRGLSAGGGIAKSTIKRIVSSLKVFYNWAHMDGHSTHDAAYFIKAPRLDKNLPVYLNRGEVEQLIEYINKGKTLVHLQRRVVILLFLFCGLRARELTSLTLKRVECARNGEPLRLRIKGKGSKERIVPVSEELKMPLWDWLLHRTRLRNWDYARQYHRPKAYVTSPFLIPGTEGGEIDHSAIYKAVRKCCIEAKVTVVSPHKLRHTFATNLMRKNAPLPVIQRALGHESIATTQIYTHVEDSDIEQWVGGKQFETRN